MEYYCDANKKVKLFDLKTLELFSDFILLLYSFK